MLAARGRDQSPTAKVQAGVAVPPVGIVYIPNTALGRAHRERHVERLA